MFRKRTRRSFVKSLATVPALAALSPLTVSHSNQNPVVSGDKTSPVSTVLEGNWIDLAKASPSDALSTVPKQGHWRSVPWKARHYDQTLQGTMLMVGPETNAPEITIDPKLTGPHELFVGLPVTWAPTHPIRIKLDNDPCYVQLVSDHNAEVQGVAYGTGIQDGRFRAVDMTGRRLQIADAGSVQAAAGDFMAGIAYIRAVPIPESGLDKHTKKGLRLVATNDGFGTFYTRRPPLKEEQMWEDVLPFRDSGVSALQWCITGADLCNYPTRVGTLLGKGSEDFPHVGDRYYFENIRALLERGIDPVASMMKMTRSIGLEFHLAVRMQGFALSPPYDGFFMSTFYAAHPELRCVDRDGRALPRLSYAYDEVREHMFAIIEELTAYEPDGINFIFSRGFPLVLYEEPFLKEFRARYGRDPRKLPEDDSQVLALRAEFVNNFIREARRRTRVPSGRRVEMSAIVLSDLVSNRFYGLDVLRWVKERWVDEISPSVYNAQIRTVHAECAYLAQACRQSGCRLVVNMRLEGIPPGYLPTALRYRAEGAQGFSIWDLDPRRPTEWSILKAIGHLDNLPNHLATEPVVIPFEQLGDFVMDRYPSCWSF